MLAGQVRADRALVVVDELGSDQPDAGGLVAPAAAVTSADTPRLPPTQLRQQWLSPAPGLRKPLLRLRSALPWVHRKIDVGLCNLCSRQLEPFQARERSKWVDFPSPVVWKRLLEGEREVQQSESASVGCGGRLARGAVATVACGAVLQPVLRAAAGRRQWLSRDRGGNTRQRQRLSREGSARQRRYLTWV